MSESDTIHGAFAAVAERLPDKVAVQRLDSTDPAPLSFSQLQEAALLVAAALRHASHTASRVVAVLTDSSPARLVAYLGVLNAGFAFCPLEAGSPDAATRSALASLRPACVVATAQFLPLLGEVASLLLLEESGAVLQSLGLDAPDGQPATASSLAHVCLTSGTSTGTPRLLACGHLGSLSSHAWRSALGPPLQADDVTAANVFGVWDAVGSLLAGGSVICLPDAVARSGRLAAALLRGAVTRLMLTPTLAASLLGSPLGGETLSRLRLLTLCGEPSTPALLDSLRAALSAPGSLLVDLYSLSETHDAAATLLRAGGARSFHIAPHCELHLLSSEHPPLPPPPGEAGTLWVSGPGLAEGEVRPDGSLAPLGSGFEMLHLPGGPPIRAFATGDLTRRGPDGALAILGRSAGEAKLKLAGGATLRAEEVEQAARRHPRVADAAAALRGGVLVAFLVAADAADDELLPSDRALREAMAELLPPHALPQRFVWLASLPLGPTGKLRRAALELPEAEAEEGPPGEEERARALFRAGLRRIGLQPPAELSERTHWALDCGGNSVAAAAMLAEARLPPGSLAQFMALPELGTLARLLRGQGPAGLSLAAEAAAAAHDSACIPLACEEAALEPAAERDSVVLSGATGFIGGEVAAALLRAGARVVCLVRAPDQAAADARLRALLAERCGAEAATLAARAVALPFADRASPALLAEVARARAFVCASGKISLAAPYAQLRGGNVLAAAALMRLALRSARDCPGSPSFHLLSSSAALAPAGGKPLAASLVAAQPPPGAGGYTLAKWAAEALAARLAAGGVDVIIHRVGYVMPTGEHVSPPMDAQRAVLGACAALRLAPVLERPQLMEWRPVRSLARALARAALVDWAGGGLAVMHHGGCGMTLGDALALGPPTAAAVPAAAWADAVAQEAPHSRCDALRHAAALVAAVGVEAALGAADARLLDSCSAEGGWGLTRSNGECAADTAEVERQVARIVLGIPPAWG